MTDRELIKTLVRARPVTADVASVNRAVAIMRDFVAAAGLFHVVERVDGRDVLYASTRPGPVPDFLLNAHLDVVPASREGQFEPVDDGDFIRGRGAMDCLGNAVCVARVLADNKDRASVGAVFSTDEERGGASAAFMVERGYGARRAVVVADGGWNGGRITIAQKGILVVSLAAKGRGGHASKPWLLDNPIDRLVAGYARLRAAWPDPAAEAWTNTMAPCVVEGGGAENQVPDGARMLVNIRYVNGEDREGILESLRATTGLEVEVARGCPPVSSPEDAPEMARLARVFERVTGRAASFGGMHGATDARHFARFGLPIAITGLDGHGAHSADEAVDFSSFATLREILCRFTAGEEEK